MSDTAQCETPMADHVERFWQLLATEHVRILIDIRRNHNEGQPSHWDSASFPNDVAKAIVAQRGTSDDWPDWFPASPTDMERGEELFLGGYTWTLRGDDGPKHYRYREGRWHRVQTDAPSPS